MCTRVMAVRFCTRTHRVYCAMTAWTISSTGVICRSAEFPLLRRLVLSEACLAWLGARVAYVLEAVIGSSPLLRACSSGVVSAGLCELAQGLAMLPMIEQVRGEVGDGSASPLGFEHLPGGFDRVLAEWSAGGRVGYVEAEFFGGEGTQRAVVWEAGIVVFGPVWSDEGDPCPEGTPISRALACLGVVQGEAFDEFAAVGLGRHRWTSDWIRQ
jgi:hypothetical protein